ncbi:MAG: GHMP kinase [Acidobacteriota bacterium]|jgi:D-glycero-alpha-D-manno-heptose-7-phosphate kinase
MIVEARAPTRIDLAGGTLDIPPLDVLVPGACTVNVAIDLLATARVEPVPGGFEIVSVDRDLHLTCPDLDALRADARAPLLTGLVAHLVPAGGVRLTTDCGSPAGAGLGGSSALAVAAGAALAGFAGTPLPEDRLLAVARDVETRVLGVPTGVQDYLAAIRGGALSITFGIGGPAMERLAADLEALQERTVLVYTGQPRSSGINNWEVTRRFVDGDREVGARLETIARQAGRAQRALLAGDLDELAAAVGAEWAARRELAPGVTTPRLEALFDAARRAGAVAAKVCGAGGGGCAVLLAPPGRRPAVEAAAREAGARVLAFRFVPEGVVASGVD